MQSIPKHRQMLVASLIAFLAIGLGVQYWSTHKSSTPTVKNDMHRIVLRTNQGEIAFETYDADAPKTVENFITLANKGFYDNVIFHRVIQGFMIQGGDGQYGKLPSVDAAHVGQGGPGYSFADELNPNTESGRNGYKRGVVAMANAGPNTNGSQFFIMLQDTPLPFSYTIFGHVVSGQDVVDKIGAMQTNSSDRPLENAVIEKIEVQDVK